MTVYEFYAAIRTDPATAEVIRDTIEAAANGIIAPETVDEGGWIRLVAAEALVRASLDKRLATEPVRPTRSGTIPTANR